MAEDGGRNYAQIIEKAGSLLLLTFITKLPEQSSAEFFAWYEEHHAPDFLSFATPHMARYGRNFVVGSLREPGFDVITEFVYKSAADQAAVMKLLTEPASDVLRWGPRGASKSVSVSVAETLVAGPARGRDKVPTAKKAILLTATSADGFAAAAKTYAASVAKQLGSDARRVVLDAAVPDKAGPPLFDAVIMIWPVAGTLDVQFTAPAGAPFTIANVLDLATYDFNG